MSINNFVALDFETANYYRSSICSMGAVIVEDGKITDRFYQLVRPVPNFYCDWATEIHGLAYFDTLEADFFPYVWKEIASKIAGLPLVAHNCIFDESCLKAAFRLFELPYPNYEFHCTYRASRKAFPDLINYKLPTVANHIGFNFNSHHNALADAEVCAMIAREVL